MSLALSNLLWRYLASSLVNCSYMDSHMLNRELLPFIYLFFFFLGGKITR